MTMQNTANENSMVKGRRRPHAGSTRSIVKNRNIPGNFASNCGRGLSDILCNQAAGIDLDSLGCVFELDQGLVDLVQQSFYDVLQNQAVDRHNRKCGVVCLQEDVMACRDLTNKILNV